MLSIEQHFVNLENVKNASVKRVWLKEEANDCRMTKYELFALT